MDLCHLIESESKRFKERKGFLSNWFHQKFRKCTTNITKMLSRKDKKKIFAKNKEKRHETTQFWNNITSEEERDGSSNKWYRFKNVNVPLESGDSQQNQCDTSSDEILEKSMGDAEKWEDVSTNMMTESQSSCSSVITVIEVIENSSENNVENWKEPESVSVLEEQEIDNRQMMYIPISNIEIEVPIEAEYFYLDPAQICSTKENYEELITNILKVGEQEIMINFRQDTAKSDGTIRSPNIMEINKQILKTSNEIEEKCVLDQPDYSFPVLNSEDTDSSDWKIKSFIEVRCVRSSEENDQLEFSEKSNYKEDSTIDLQSAEKTLSKSLQFPVLSQNQEIQFGEPIAIFENSQSSSEEWLSAQSKSSSESNCESKDYPTFGRTKKANSDTCQVALHKNINSFTSSFDMYENHGEVRITESLTTIHPKNEDTRYLSHENKEKEEESSKRVNEAKYVECTTDIFYDATESSPD
ncbi:uncharacterized protein [Centruroides vittatus]|uniref:uncharacterized protein n=1 Tax=Centruroides vittatus TaxID=120091 RepID=UPI00350EC0B1